MADIRDFRLPDLGEGLEEGEIVAWHVAVGDVVELNQPIADIETAKAVVAVPSPFAGRIVERLGAVGDTLEVGSVLVRIDLAGEDAVRRGGADRPSPAQGGPAGGDADADRRRRSPASAGRRRGWTPTRSPNRWSATARARREPAAGAGAGPRLGSACRRP
jgi:2-oxoisovalerate dehydrogenase E2 component (dihydrolipoyl transacylase)